MSDSTHVLSLGYTTALFRAKSEAANDSVNRRLGYAQKVGSYTVVTLTRDSDGFDETTIADNVRVIPTRGRNLPHALWRMYRIGREICAEGRVNVLQMQEPQVTGLVGMLLSRRFGLPMSVCVFGPNPFDRHWRHASLFNRVSAHWGRAVLRRVDAIIVDGSLTLERLQQAGLPRERMTWKPMIPSNIDRFSTADGGPLRRRLLDGGTSGRFEQLLISVGTMSIQKNVPFVLRAFARIVERVPKTRLVLVGQGRRKPEYQQLAQRLGVAAQVLWLDAVPHQEIADYFHACDVLLMGSRFEGFPRVLMESAAAGLPIVTTEVSGCTDAVVPGGNGYVLDQGDLAGFVDRVVELLVDREKAREMGGRGKPLMQQLAAGRERFDQMQIEVWDRVAAGRASEPV